MKEFKLRAECAFDIGKLLQVCNVVTMTMTTPHVPDVEITFTSHWTLAKIKQVIAAIPDGHVMLETVALASNYTGERN